jgi:hypothetical protein
MLSRTERIDEYHLRLSPTEKEVYEEFLKTEEAALVQEMQQYFIQAKAHAGGIRFDNGRYTYCKSVASDGYGDFSQESNSHGEAAVRQLCGSTSINSFQPFRKFQTLTR